MALKYIELPLYPNADYEYSVALEGQSYLMRFTYNETMKLYTIEMLTSELVTLISGVGLVPNYPLLLDYNIGGLTGSFVMIPISDKPIEFYKLYPDKLDQYYKLSYVYAVAD